MTLRILALGCILTAISCSPSPPIKIPETRPAPKPAVTTPTPEVKLPPAPKPILPPPTPQSKLPISYQQRVIKGITLSMVSYDDRDHQLRIADQPNGLGSRWSTAQEAAATYRGVAAINGGFFTPEGKPLGQLIETGTKRGYINKSSLGAGFFTASNQRSAIVRRAAYLKNKAYWNPYNLLQTGPMLTNNSSPISGLSKNNSRPRSFIAWDGKHYWAIGHASACTLAELSQALAGKSPAGFPIKVAINLDGGRSSDLWASSQISNSAKTHRGFLNKPVRNYLVLTRK